MSLKIFIYKDHTSTTGLVDVIQAPLDEYTNLIQFGRSNGVNPQCKLQEASIDSDGKYLYNKYCRYCYEVVPNDGIGQDYTWCQINPGLLKENYAIGGYQLRKAISGEPSDSNWSTSPQLIGNSLGIFGQGAKGLGEKYEFGDLMGNYDMLFIDFTIVKVDQNKLTLLSNSSQYISNPLLAIDSSSGRRYPLAAIDDSTKKFAGYMHA